MRSNSFYAPTEPYNGHYIDNITYIIDHYNLSVRITTWLPTPLLLCALILYMSDGTYSLKSTPNEKLLVAKLSEFLREIC